MILPAALVVLSVLQPPPFADLQPQPQVQSFLRADVLRRSRELTSLGWVGRAWLVAPFVVERLLPGAFRLSAYSPAAAACFACPSGRVECTLRESSLIGGPKGIPFHLSLTRDAQSRIIAASLRGIGCDLCGDGEAAAMRRMEERDVSLLCAAINDDSRVRKLVVKAITSTIFDRLPNVMRAAREGEAVEACGAEEAFLPREELYGREGSSMKWVQQVSGYFFAQSRLQRVRFASQPRERLLFYFDPSEPLNSEEPGRIVNPEVVNCVFL